MKVELKKIDKLTWSAVFDVAQSFNDIDLRASDEPMYQALISILFEIQNKLQSKVKDINLNRKKHASLTLKYYQAWAFDWYIGAYLDKEDGSPYKPLLINFRLKINQQLHKN